MSLTRPLTRPLTRKISRAELTQGYGGSFSPLLLNPYLLFDARESMVGTLENPTLDLNPALPETLDVITATRSGTATYTDPDGNIATAAADTVRVDYTQGAELTPTKFQNIGYTDFANSYWIARGFTKVGTVDGPLGYTGYEFLENNSNSNPAVYVNSDLSDGSPMTFGVWLKASSPVSIALATTGSVRTSTINVTTEWQFFSCADNINTNTGPHIGGFATITQGSGVTLFAAMPQLEEGTTASSFVANTTGSPKFITGATYGPRVPMILVEPSATNLLTYSEDFSTWSKDDTSVVSGQLSPSGNETAFLLKGNNNASRHNIVKFGVINTVTGSFSIFAKAKELKYLQIASANTASQYANFDLLSGTIGTVASDFSDAKMEAYPDGWYRITVVSPNRYNAYYISLVSSLTAGWLESWSMPNDTDGLYIWGAQLEEGSVATSYIPTLSGSTVTRQADDLVISGSDFTDFYNSSEGTIYTESTGRGYFDFNTTFAFSDNSASNRIYARSTSTSGGLAIFSGGSASASMGGLTVVANNVLSRSAHSFKANNFLTSRDGISATPDTSGNMPVGIDRLYIGAGDTGGNQLNGHIKRLIYWPYHSDSL